MRAARAPFSLLLCGEGGARRARPDHRRLGPYAGRRCSHVAPAPAHAADPITTQEYFSYYHLDKAREKGYTGKGITIALFDGPVDTSAPELAGANIVDKSRCTVNDSPDGVRHATDMATLLVSPYTGVAPDATLYTYQISSEDTQPGGTCVRGG